MNKKDKETLEWINLIRSPEFDMFILAAFALVAGSKIVQEIKRIKFYEFLENLFCAVLILFMLVTSLWLGIMSHPWMFK